MQQGAVKPYESLRMMPLNKTKFFRLLLLLSAFSLGCSQSSEPSVKQIVEPQYPIKAQCNNVEGVVDLIVQGGANGRVLSVTEGSNSGVDGNLIAEAKDNAVQWLWGPFPQKFQFPWYHNVRYVFKLQGKRTAFPVRPPIVRTRLPDQIEVIAVPCYHNLEIQMVPAQPPVSPQPVPRPK